MSVKELQALTQKFADAFIKQGRQWKIVSAPFLLSPRLSELQARARGRLEMHHDYQ